eukprot:COSAG03_NODE_10964_length_618_cov_228.668593_2_plen_155_part_01
MKAGECGLESALIDVADAVRVAQPEVVRLCVCMSVSVCLCLCVCASVGVSVPVCRGKSLVIFSFVIMTPRPLVVQAAQLLSAVCGWVLCVTTVAEAETEAATGWLCDLTSSLAASVPLSQEALSLLDTQLWSHLDSPTGEGLLALRQAGAAAALG